MWSAPLSTYLDTQTVLTALHELNSPLNVSTHITDWLSKLEARHPPEDDVWSEPLKTLLDPDVYEAIELNLGKGEPIDEALLQELMEIELVSIILRRLVEKILEAFVEGVLNRDSPRISSVGRSAFGFAARASKGLFEKVSAQIEGPLRQTMTGFVQGSMDRVKEQLADILRSDEIRDKLGDAKQALFRYHANKTLGEWRTKAMENNDRIELVDHLTKTARHLTGHTIVHTIVETEVDNLLSELGDQPISSIVPEETRQQLDEWLGQKLIVRWTEFFQSDAFDAALKG